ncbi:HNH endonuclease [Candidatus Poriferisodalis sp.]|uniref:HNH endonuclease signature motif containing protein n=1 Tax=Candidatus Poriferisodalis sp. TaxID=3101277 RepID=UPI003B01160E
MFSEVRVEGFPGSRVAAPEARRVGRSDGPAGLEGGEPDWAELNREAAKVRIAVRGAERGPFLEAQCAARLGLESLTDSDLLDRVVKLTAERSRIEAEYLAAVGELVSRDGVQSAAWQLREYTRMNGAQARSEARLAESLTEHSLGDTLDALAAGEIHMSHAKVIARETPKTHRRSESDFLGLCRDYPSDVVARHSLAYESEQVFADLAAEAAAATPGGTVEPADAELALQRHQRRCSMRLGDDGMWHLNADLDFLVGRQVSMQLAAAERAVRQRDDSAEDTFPQRNADALCDLILGRQRPGASLVIAADYDSVSGQLTNPRLDDGTPISANQLAELAADAKILPAIFNSDWSQLALGRVRSASEAQRIILAIRDGGCIACATHSERCHAHHIDYFEDGGHTDIPNLANLCEPCHLDHHQRHWPIETPASGRPRRAPPDRRPNRPASPEPSGRDPTSSPHQDPTRPTGHLTTAGDDSTTAA